MKAKSKVTGSVITKQSIGQEDPVESSEMLYRDDLENYEGSVAETGVMLGLTLPLPPAKGQKMGPWVKVDVTVSLPCANNKTDLQTTNEFCQSFAEDRLSEIARKVIDNQVS